MKINRDSLLTIVAVVLVAAWIAWALLVAVPKLGWGW